MEILLRMIHHSPQYWFVHLNQKIICITLKGDIYNFMARNENHWIYQQKVMCLFEPFVGWSSDAAFCQLWN